MNQLKALVILLLASGLAAWLASGALRPWLDAARYRALWLTLLAATAALFALGHSGLLMAALVVIVLLAPSALRLGAAGTVGLYLALCVTMPPVSLTLPGLGGINQVLELSVPRLVALVALLPLALRLAQAPPPQGVARVDWRWVDCMVVGYEVMSVVSQMGEVSGTHLVRLSLLGTLDMLLPYYVVTRGLIGWDQLRAALAVFVTAMALVCVATYIEQLLRWPMYSDLQVSYGQRWVSTWILTRGSLLRVRAMSPQPILLGYVLIFGLGYWMALSGTRWRERANLMVTGAMLLALYFTVSRGPMMGAAVFLISLLALHWLAPARYGRILAFVAVAFSVTVVMGWDEALVSGIKQLWGEPAGADSSIDYRKQLLDAATALVRAHPWVGVPNYLYYMEHLRQGEGIIDLVNTYVYVALAHGLVGLALFVLPFVIVVRRMLRRLARVQGEDAMMARALISLVVAALFVLFTTSNWWVMPQLNVTLVALCLAYTRLPVAAPSPPPEVPPHDMETLWAPYETMLDVREER